jgi:hypothetical protein
MCRSCQTDFSLIAFPALTAPSRSAKPKAVEVEEGATCFFHDQNSAETVCSGCGRYLCAVCNIDFGGEPKCPACVAADRRGGSEAILHRILYDRIALGLAVLPLLLWPLTLVTAPAALGVVAYGWRQPASILSKSRARFVIAGVLASVQLGGWVFFFGTLWVNR